MSTLPKPQYTIWQALAAAIALAQRAIEEVRALARQPGPPGPPGRIEDVKEVVEDGGRILVRTYICGEQTLEFRHVLATMIYRDIYREGVTYERGDVVTWAGAMWHCNEETTEKPGDGSKAWTLAVKKGRDKG